MLTSLQRAVAVATIVASSAASGALAQETAADPSQPEALEAETAPSTGGAGATDQIQGTQPDQSDLMGEGMMSGPMDQPTTGQGMMCSNMCSGMLGGGATCSEMCSGMMGQGAMGQGAMSQGMGPHGGMNGALRPGQVSSGMHGHMMKIVFAIADADGNGGLSLDELAAVQGRVFDAVDTNEDGSVMPEELRAFIGE